MLLENELCPIKLNYLIHRQTIIFKGDILFFFATAQSSWMSDKSTNKAPSSVKTDTKAAASVHPYSMPNRTTSRTGP